MKVRDHPPPHSQYVTIPNITVSSISHHDDPSPVQVTTMKPPERGGGEAAEAADAV